MLRAGDIVNREGDIYIGPFSLPLASGKILLPFKQAFRAMQYGWEWKGATGDAATGVVEVWVQRGGEVWLVRRRRI